MTEDLYKLYQAAWQRAKRRPWDTASREIEELAYELVRHRPGHDEMLAMARKMAQIEGSDAPSGTPAARFLRALEARNYVINIPFMKLRSWDEQANSHGYIYIATSKSRPGECKLGVTKTDTADRFASYASKYGEILELYWKEYIVRPYALESAMTQALAEQRVIVDTRTAKSVEWYRMEPKVLKAILVQVTEFWT